MHMDVTASVIFSAAAVSWLFILSVYQFFQDTDELF